MSSRGWAGALVASVLLAPFTPGALPAQEASRRQELRERIERLTPLVEEADARRRTTRALWELRAREEVSGLLDTVRAGPLSVVAHKSEIARARAVMLAAWDASFRPFVGPGGATVLGDAVFVVRLNKPIPDLGPGSYLVASAPRALSAERAIGQAIAERTPASVLAWLGTGMVVPTRDWAMRYRTLVLSRSRSAHDCVRGSDTSCLWTLGLDPSGADPDLDLLFEQWYTPEQARDHFAARREIRTGAVGARCLSDEPEQCHHALALLEEPWLSAPVDRWTRASLLGVALELGGTGALDRLVAIHDDNVAGALVRVAGVDLEALAAAWRARVEEAHPAHHGSGNRRDRRTALAWVSVFAVLAMTNTRWRLGR